MDLVEISSLVMLVFDLRATNSISVYVNEDNNTDPGAAYYAFRMNLNIRS